MAIYINDEELSSCFEKLLEIVDKKAMIYISGSVAIDERLTLERFYAENLKSEYSVIYRTIDEYKCIFKKLLDNGFKIMESKSFLNEMNQYSETERHYFILYRN